MSKLKKIIARMISAEEIGQKINPDAARLIEEYSDCKNLYGKISPYVIIVKRHLEEMQSMQSVEQISQFVQQKMLEYRELFKNANVDSKTFNYNTDAKLREMQMNFRKCRNDTNQAIQYLYNALLRGEGLGTSASAVDTISISELLADKNKMKYVVALLQHFSK